MSNEPRYSVLCLCINLFYLCKGHDLRLHFKLYSRKQRHRNMSLARSERADKRTKSIIHGYVLKHRNQFDIKMPDIIQLLIILYYWIEEKFTDHGDSISIDDESLTVTHTGETTNFSNTVYGNNVIDYTDTSITEYIWRIKVLKVDPHRHHYSIPFCIGLDSSDNQYINEDYSAFKTGKQNKVYKMLKPEQYEEFGVYFDTN